MEKFRCRYCGRLETLDNLDQKFQHPYCTAEQARLDSWMRGRADRLREAEEYRAKIERKSLEIAERRGEVLLPPPWER